MLAPSVDAQKQRYDRLRGIAGRIQAVLGDIATQGVRVQSAELEGSKSYSSIYDLLVPRLQEANKGN
ncbi:hypothetical protein EV2_004460 [Malus domestica]